MSNTRKHLTAPIIWSHLGNEISLSAADDLYTKNSTMRLYALDQHDWREQAHFAEW